MLTASHSLPLSVPDDDDDASPQKTAHSKRAFAFRLIHPHVEFNVSCYAFDMTVLL